MGLSIRSSSFAGNTHVLAVEGELDAVSAPLLEERLSEVIGSDGLEVVVDLAEVTFIDSVGLQAFVAAGDVLRSSDGHLTLVIDDPRIAKLIAMTGLGRLFTIKPSLTDAVSHVVELR